MCSYCDRAESLYGLGSVTYLQVRSLYHPPDRPKEPAWRYLTWFEFCRWLDGRKVRHETKDTENYSSIRLEFEDGSIAILESNYDGGYSEYTPGEGIQPPSVKVRP